MASTPSTRRQLDGVAVWDHSTHWLICAQVSWADYFLRTAHARMLAEKGAEHRYAETGQAVLARANRPVAGAPPVKPDFATRREHGALAFAANEHADDDTLRVEDV
jgi:hypothetical protein